MPRKAGTRYQQQVYEARLAQIDRDWQGYRRTFFVGGRQPTWLGVLLAALVGGVGLAFLAWSLRLLAAEGALWPTSLLLGGTMAVTGGTAAVLTLVQLLRCRAAEGRYLGRRAEVRLEDCPRHPPTQAPGQPQSHAEEGAGDFLLDEG